MCAARALCAFFNKHAKNNLFLIIRKYFSFNFNASLIIDSYIYSSRIINFKTRNYKLIRKIFS